MSSKKIVFYDGDCGFCNRSVNFILKNDKTKQVLFAAIQSKFTQDLFKEKGFDAPNLSTFYFFENDTLYSKSSGAKRLTKYFKFPQRILALGWIVPRFIADWGYDFIAKRRQRLSKGYCVIPSEEEKKRFIM
ncbi:MAG: putative DCC family thiol-disulfide oxidoreductase YuxK [Salibacteraceae bacterium]|jgi:predicted DCC family thiol-disulfide oxidoreductase YuxK